MRKLVVMIIAVLYFGVSSGMVVTIHQCMGKVSSVSLNEKEKPCKCSAKAKKKMPCCKSHSQLVKISAEHQLAALSFAFLSLPAELPIYQEVSVAVQPMVRADYDYFSHAPPDISEKIYLRNQVFRI